MALRKGRVLFAARASLTTATANLARFKGTLYGSVHMYYFVLGATFAQLCACRRIQFHSTENCVQAVTTLES